MQLDYHAQMILDEYNEKISVFQKIQEIVETQLRKCIADNNLYVNAIESRLKSEKSLTGKLLLKGPKYNSVKDITDIVGARVITFYTDEVDKIAALVDKIFEIDQTNIETQQEAASTELESIQKLLSSNVKSEFKYNA